MARATSAEAAIRCLAAARFISFAGTQASYVALIALVYERSGGSGVWIAVALLAGLGARVAASPWAGTLADYLDRRWVMVASDIAGAACFVAISGTTSLPVLVALAAVAGVAEAPFGPASGALVAALVPEGRRGWANGTISIGASGGMVVGAASGGVLVASLGAPTAFLLNAASFLASAALASTIRGRHAGSARHEAEHRGVWLGVRLLGTERVLRLAAVGFALVCLALGMTNVAELPLFLDIGAGKAGFGIAVAAWAAGQIVGGRLAGRITDSRLERRSLIAGCALASGVIASCGVIPTFALIALLFVLGGVGNTLMNLGAVMMVQRWAPPQVRSRALAAFEALGNTAIGVSLVSGGLLLSPLGPRAVFVLSGGLGCIAVALALRIPRQPDRIAPDAQPARPTRRGAGGGDATWPLPVVEPAS